MSPQNPDLPVDSASIIEDRTLDKESVIDLLGEDDDEQETLELEESHKKDKQEKTGKSDEVSEEAREEKKELTLEEELEEELKKPDEEELEFIETPSRKEILTAYPDLFKKFPQLERSIYRERAYSEILPTIADAEVAVEKAQLLDDYEKEIMGGSTVSLLSTVRDNDKESFAKIVDNYLPTLFSVDQHAYYHTIGNVIKHTIVSMVNDSKEQNNEELSEAAAILNQYMFGSTKFTHPQNLSRDEATDEDREKEKEVSRREREFLERQYNSASNDLGISVDNILKASVDRAIDPNDSMTDYTKKNATREVLEGLEDLISRDTRFRAIYDKLWERAFDNDFNRESMDRIKSAYLSKAKTLLPLLIKRSRNEALRGLNKRNSDEKDRKGPLPVGKTRSSTTSASGRASSSSNSKQIPKGMTTLEYLNRDD